MMGAGKSSVGQCLHGRTGLVLHDTDEIVTSNFGMSIPEIFDEHGEKKFREAETEALRSVRTEDQTIIITGGGIVLRKENVEILKRLGAIVWLDGDEEILFARASRKRIDHCCTRNTREKPSRKSLVPAGLFTQTSRISGSIRRY